MKIRPVGHTLLLDTLSTELPHATLLLGPDSIGKNTVVDYLIDVHGYKDADLCGGRGALTADGAREALAVCQTRPVGRSGRLVRASLDGSSSEALNMILKIVEEPPPKTKFIFTANRTPLLTILSRCHVFRMGLLSEEDMTEILQRLGYDDDQAERLAAMSGGTVEGALRADRMDNLRGPVLSALKATASNDVELMSNALRKFDDEASWLLRRWAVEARTGRWALFSKEESFGLQDDAVHLDMLIAALSRPGRPRLAATVALTKWRKSRG